MNRILIRFLLTGLIFFPLHISAQSENYSSDVSKRGTTAANFLEIGAGARAISMGGAFVAVADDPTAIYWNVSGLAKFKKHGIIFNHTNWIADLRYDFLGATFTLGTYGAIGLSVISLSSGEMAVRTIEQPEGTGQVFDVSSLAVSLAYAINLTSNFSIGINLKFIREAIWDMSALGGAIDLGVHYITPFKRIILGMAITNFGTKMRMDGDNALVLHDPDLSTSGNNDRIPANLKMDEWALPLNFRVGISYHAVQAERHSLIFALDAQHPNNNYESVNVGAEYVFNNLLALRAGYKNLFLADSEESLTLGAGLQYRVLGNVVFHFDFAYADFGRLENVFKYSLSVDF